MSKLPMLCPYCKKEADSDLRGFPFATVGHCGVEVRAISASLAKQVWDDWVCACISREATKLMDEAEAEGHE